MASTKPPVVKEEPPAPPAKTTPATSAAASNNNNNNCKNNSNSSKGNGKGPLPSFCDLLWCPDVDGDVMTQGIGGAMVSASELVRRCLLQSTVRSTRGTVFVRLCACVCVCPSERTYLDMTSGNVSLVYFSCLPCPSATIPCLT